MEQCDVTATRTGRKVRADILSRSDKSIKVVLVGSDITLILNRTDLRKPYVGNKNGMEFTTNG